MEAWRPLVRAHTMHILFVALLLAAPLPPAPEPPQEPAPVRTNNVSFNITITRADGSTKSMAVKGLERSEDFHADKGWTSNPADLKFTVEVIGKGEKEVAWTDVKSITIVPGKMPDDVDCSYNSDFNPFMYECSIRTTTTAVLKDGTKGPVTTRNLWRLSDGEGAVEFYLYKHTERMQGDPVPGQDQEEDAGMYSKLQQNMRETLKTKLVKSITIQ